MPLTVFVGGSDGVGFQLSQRYAETFPLAGSGDGGRYAVSEPSIKDEQVPVHEGDSDWVPPGLTEFEVC